LPRRFPGKADAVFNIHRDMGASSLCPSTENQAALKAIKTVPVSTVSPDFTLTAAVVLHIRHRYRVIFPINMQVPVELI
jgi:hypothetical protein